MTDYYKAVDRPGYWGDIAGRFSSDVELLDLGCGTGWLADHFPSYTGLELSEDAVHRARSLQRNVQVGDADRPLPFPDASFDAVIAKDVLEHVVAPVQLVLEIRRVLRPGGQVWACSPDAQRWVWEDYTHRRGFPRPAFRRLFSDQGFDLLGDGYETVCHGSSLVSDRTPGHRRPAVLRAVGRMPFIRRNVWVLAAAPS